MAFRIVADRRHLFNRQIFGVVLLEKGERALQLFVYDVLVGGVPARRFAVWENAVHKLKHPRLYQKLIVKALMMRLLGQRLYQRLKLGVKGMLLRDVLGHDPFAAVYRVEIFFAAGVLRAALKQ